MKNDDLVTTFSQCRTTSYFALGSEARLEYTKACRIMMARGTLRIGDLPVVAAYAQAQIDVREAHKEIDKLGLVLVSEDRYGNPKHEANPAVKIRKDAANQVSNLALMLGFTPLGRKRLKGEETPPESDLDKFMRGLNDGSKA